MARILGSEIAARDLVDVWQDMERCGERRDEAEGAGCLRAR